MDYFEKSVDLHKKYCGKLSVVAKSPVLTLEDLSIQYTPGVARPCELISEQPERVRELTIKNNTVAVVTDGSAVLGLGNIGAEAALPVMEGKAVLFKQYADIDAWPICLDTQKSREIIQTIRHIAPGFGGINLEDIAAPRCFEIERALQDLNIPVFHDDQHGTAIVLLAAMINAARVVGKPLEEMKVVINGAGAAGTAIANLLRCVNQDPTICTPVQDVIVCDSKGAIHFRRSDLSREKQQLLPFTNKENKKGSVKEILNGMDVFVGVSKGNLITGEDVKRMNKHPIILAMANPTPEIHPDEALKAGAAIVGTGRSDYPNQVNNVLAFPGIFRGALDAGATTITPHMKIAAAYALANTVKEPVADKILPGPFDPGIAEAVAQAVKEAWQNEVTQQNDDD